MQEVDIVRLRLKLHVFTRYNRRMYRALQTCLEPFKADCQSDSIYQGMVSTFAQIGQACKGMYVCWSFFPSCTGIESTK
jgi:hypothetical protein